MLESLASLFAPWAGYYADHTWLSTAITYSHIAALLWGGGRAVTADLMTLRSRGLNEFRAEGHLKFLKASHRDVLMGLTVAAISGVLMFTSDFKHFVNAPIYWAKMSSVAILLGNGVFLTRAERGLDVGGGTAEAAFAPARRHAAVSLFFWFGTTLLGLLVSTA